MNEVTTNQGRAARRFRFREEVGLPKGKQGVPVKFHEPTNRWYRSWNLLMDISQKFKNQTYSVGLAAPAQLLTHERPLLVIYPMSGQSREAGVTEAMNLVTTATEPILIISKKMIDGPIASIDF